MTDMKESGGTNMTSFVVVSDGLGKGMVVLGCGRRSQSIFVTSKSEMEISDIYSDYIFLSFV